MSSLATDFQVGYKSGSKASSFLWALYMSCLTTNCSPGGGVDPGNLVSKVFLLPCDCLKGFELFHNLGWFLGYRLTSTLVVIQISVVVLILVYLPFFYCKELACFKKLVFN